MPRLLSVRVFYGWAVVAVAWVLWLYNTMAFTWGFTVFVKPLDQEFGWSRTSITLAWAATLAWSLLLGPWAGRLFDRVGPRPLTVVFGPVAGLGWMAIALAHSYWAFLLAFVFLVGTGLQLGLTVNAQGVVAQWFRRLAMGVFLTSSGATGVTLVPFISWLTAAYTWRTGAFVLGALIAATTVPLGLLLRHRPEDMGLQPDGGPALPAPAPEGWRGALQRALARLPLPRERGHPEVDFTPRQAYATAAFWLFTVAIWTRWVGLGLLQVHQMPYLLERGLSQADAAAVVGLSLFCNSPSRILVGVLGDLYDKRWLLVGCMLFQGAGLLALTLTTSPALGYVYAVLWGIGMSALALQGAWVADAFGRRFYGSINSLTYSVSQTGRLVGGLGAAIAYDLVGSYHSMFTLGVVGFVLGALLLAVMPRPGRPHEAEPQPASLPLRRHR